MKKLHDISHTRTTIYLSKENQKFILAQRANGITIDSLITLAREYINKTGETHRTLLRQVAKVQEVTNQIKDLAKELP